MIIFAVVEYGVITGAFSAAPLFMLPAALMILYVCAKVLDGIALLFLMTWPYLALFLIFDIVIGLLMLLAKHFFKPLKCLIPVAVIIMGLAAFNPFYKPLPDSNQVAAIEVTDWIGNYERVYTNEATVKAFVNYLDNGHFRRTFEYRFKNQGEDYGPMGTVNFLTADGKVLKTIGFYYDTYILDGKFHYKTKEKDVYITNRLEFRMSEEIEENEMVDELEVSAGDASNTSDSVETMKISVQDWIINNAYYENGILTIQVPDLPYETMSLEKVSLTMRLAKYDSARFKGYVYKELKGDVVAGDLIEIPIESIIENNTVDQLSVLFRYNGNMEDAYFLKSALPIELQNDPEK